MSDSQLETLRSILRVGRVHVDSSGQPTPLSVAVAMVADDLGVSRAEAHERCSRLIQQGLAQSTHTRHIVIGFGNPLTTLLQNAYHSVTRSVLRPNNQVALTRNGIELWASRDAPGVPAARALLQLKRSEQR